MTDLLQAPGTPRASWQAAIHDLSDQGRFEELGLGDPGPTSGSGHLDQTVEISPKEAAKRHSNSLSGLVSESIYVPIRTQIEFRLDVPVHMLLMYQEGARRDGETLIDGIVSSRLRNFTNKLTFVPAGHPYREWHDTSAPLRLTYLYVDPAKLRTTDKADDDYFPRTFFEDSAAWETAAKLKSVIESGRTGSVCYSEALVSVLAHELSRTGEQGDRPSPLSRGGLAGWQTRAITTYVEQHLDEQVSLKTLAEVVHLSQYHFCRAFKQSFGIAPHEYHVNRRIERAKTLLADRAASILEVALSLGYSQASSFTIAFRRVTGRTPSEFRRHFA